MKASSVRIVSTALMAGLSLVISAGCATVTRGTSQALVIESEPPGADVELSNGLRGKTPTSFLVKRKQSVVVTISKQGYESVTVDVTSAVSGGGAAGMAGNVIVGGLIGAVVDSSSGATKELKPNPVRVNLVKIREAK